MCFPRERIDATCASPADESVRRISDALTWSPMAAFPELPMWSGLLPGEHRLLEFVDRVVAAFQAQPPQLEKDGTRRRMDEVVA